LMWSSSEEQEIHKPIKASFWGEGVFEEWAYGWTIETKKYMLNLSKNIGKKRAIVLGREKELGIMIRSLAVNKSVLLVGSSGSGRDSLISFLASESMAGNLKGNLYHQKIFQFMTDSFLAGAQNQGELESRFIFLIEELLHSGNILIYIPDLKNILGASSFNLDLSAALMPYLKEGAIRIISTTTEEEFKNTIEQKHELLENFEVIKLDEVDDKLGLDMVLEKVKDMDKKGINITFKAARVAVKYSDEYQRDTVLPGSAIRLLEDTISSSPKQQITEEDVIRKVEQKTKMAISAPGEAEKELLLGLEEEIHKRVIGQDEAVTAVSEAMRRLRTGLVSDTRPVSFLFLGPTGVGKTETAKALAENYFGSEDKIVRLDMSEYSTAESAKRLLGSLPGEQESGGELTYKVFENPFSLILLDEFEKAHANIEDLFLQILEDGRLTDNKGKTVNFGNCIIIATSNAGAETIRQEIKTKTIIGDGFKKELLDKLQKDVIFKPELLNRFDEIVVFKSLNQEEIKKITKLLLSDVSLKLKEKDIDIDFGEDVVLKIVAEGFDDEFGARPLRRFIQDNIEDVIAKKILLGELVRGDKALVLVDPSSSEIAIDKRE
ncbi:AAA family ATPase, partial [Patescibacteria group bacterium]|nr:AAA family ATPase [Patescibacteria group bacterium]